jgi:hypothetical protein
MFCALVVAGCSPAGNGGSAAVPAQADRAEAASTVNARPTLTEPVLIALDDDTGRLEYWPLHRNGSARPRWLSQSLGIDYATAMVANGDQLYISSASPGAITTYNVDTKATSALPVPYGAPWDLAIDRSGMLYALTSSGVTVYPNGSAKPYQLTCADMDVPYAIAVDNEAEVFVNGINPSNAPVVVEYPMGSAGCTQLPLKPEIGGPTGLAVDPNNDDLVTVDKVWCAGGREGRMTVYHRPYGSKVEHVRNLDANCPGNIRFDATGTMILFADTLPELHANLKRNRRHCIAYSCIDQRTYPDARHRRTYLGGFPGAFTTIPNALPN